MVLTALTLLFAILPVSVAVLVLGIIAASVVVVVFKLVKLVLDSIPFL